jgi:hypothetical protein
MQTNRPAIINSLKAKGLIRNSDHQMVIPREVVCLVQQAWGFTRDLTLFRESAVESHSVHCDRFRKFHSNLRNLTDDEIHLLIYED